MPGTDYFIHQNWINIRSEAFQTISWIYDKLNKTDKSVEFFRLALNIVEKYKNSDSKIYIENERLFKNTINNLILHENNKDAIKFLLKFESFYSKLPEILYIFTEKNTNEKKLKESEDKILSYYNALNLLCELLFREKDFANGEFYYKRKKDFTEIIKACTDHFNKYFGSNDNLNFLDNSMILVSKIKFI